MIGYWGKMEQNPFCYSQSRKESFLMVMCNEKKGNCMEKKIMQGTGQRIRGRPRTRWRDNITKWTGLTGDRLLRSVEDRSQWSKIIHEAANPRIEDSWIQVLGLGRLEDNFYVLGLDLEGPGLAMALALALALRATLTFGNQTRGPTTTCWSK